MPIEIRFPMGWNRITKFMFKSKHVSVVAPRWEEGYYECGCGRVDRPWSPGRNAHVFRRILDQLHEAIRLTSILGTREASVPLGERESEPVEPEDVDGDVAS